MREHESRHQNGPEVTEIAHQRAMKIAQAGLDAELAVAEATAAAGAEESIVDLQHQ